MDREKGDDENRDYEEGMNFARAQVRPRPGNQVAHQSRGVEGRSGFKDDT
jgi:hypothetical protein